jgi:hypothetical protein
VIAGALLEYAQLYSEAEKAHVLQEAKARTAGEVAELRRELARFAQAITKIQGAF